VENYGGKPLATGNFSGELSNASLEYTFEDSGENFTLRLEACCDEGQKTVGDYRLLVGINAPEVLTARPGQQFSRYLKGQSKSRLE
jgi:hypothetical protein